MNDVRERQDIPQAEGSRAALASEQDSPQASDQRTDNPAALPSNQEPGSELPFARSFGLFELSRLFEGMRDERDLANDELNVTAYRCECAEQHLKQLRMRVHQFVYCRTPEVKEAARRFLLYDAADLDRRLAALMAARKQRISGPAA